MARSLWHLSSSILLALAGVLCIVVPWISTSLIGMLFIGRMLIFCSFANLLRLLSAPWRTWEFVRKIPPVVIPLLIGALMLLGERPKLGIAPMLMIFFVLDGCAKIISTLEASSMRIDVLGLVSAGLSFFLAVFLAAIFPDAPIHLLTLFLGLDLISMAVVRKRKLSTLP